jgi:hypothetical protein
MAPSCVSRCLFVISAVEVKANLGEFQWRGPFLVFFWKVQMMGHKKQLRFRMLLKTLPLEVSGGNTFFIYIFQLISTKSCF